LRRSIKVVAIASTIFLPVSAVTAGVAQAGPAGAVTSLTCKSLKGTPGGSVEVSRCTPSGSSGRLTGGMTDFFLRAGSVPTYSSVAWFYRTGSPIAASDIQTTTASVGRGACAKGSVELDISGTVVFAANPPKGTPNLDDDVAAQICASATKYSLVRNTTFSW